MVLLECMHVPQNVLRFRDGVPLLPEWPYWHTKMCGVQ